MLHYQVYGELNNRTPLLFLHGMLGDSNNWKSQAKRFVKDCPVITVDLRNHGDSPHLKGMSYRQMADDVLSLLDHLGVTSVFLSGHSMGGKVGMYLALYYPDIIGKLVVVDIAPVIYPLWHQSIFRALLSLPLIEISSRREADDLLAQSFSDSFERAFLLKNLMRVNNQYQWKCDLEEIARNYLKIAGFPKHKNVFSGEVLFLKGENSEYIADEFKAEIVKYFPRAFIQSVANAGHLPHVQQPDLFYTYVSEFLREENIG